MTTRTLAENVVQAVDDFDSIHAAIASKGVPIPDGTPTSEYAEKIQEIGYSGTATIIPKTFTSNGVFHAVDDNADGYSPVTVNVAGGGDTGQLVRYPDFLNDIEMAQDGVLRCDGSQVPSQYEDLVALLGEKTALPVGSYAHFLPVGNRVVCGSNHSVSSIVIFNTVDDSFIEIDVPTGAYTSFAVDGECVACSGASTPVAFLDLSNDTRIPFDVPELATGVVTAVGNGKFVCSHASFMTQRVIFFDLADKSYVMINDLPSRVYGLHVLVGNQVIVHGSGNSSTDSLIAVDLADYSWTKITGFAPMVYSSFIVVGEKVLCGGHGNRAFVLVLDMSDNSWEEVTGFPAANYSLFEAVGNVVVCSGTGWRAFMVAIDLSTNSLIQATGLVNAVYDSLAGAGNTVVCGRNVASTSIVIFDATHGIWGQVDGLPSGTYGRVIELDGLVVACNWQVTTTLLVLDIPNNTSYSITGLPSVGQSSFQGGNGVVVSTTSGIESATSLFAVSVFDNSIAVATDLPNRTYNHIGVTKAGIVIGGLNIQNFAQRDSLIIVSIRPNEPIEINEVNATINSHTPYYPTIPLYIKH